MLARVPHGRHTMAKSVVIGHAGHLMIGGVEDGHGASDVATFGRVADASAAAAGGDQSGEERFGEVSRHRWAGSPTALTRPGDVALAA